MKKLALFILLTIICVSVKAQSFAVINAKSSFENIRKDKDADSPIISKIYKFCVFDCGDMDIKDKAANDITTKKDKAVARRKDAKNKPEWVKVYQQTFDDDTAGISGYVRKNKVTLLSALPQVKKIQVFDDSCIAQNDSLKIIVKSWAFNYDNHTYVYRNDDVLAIDGKTYWGTNKRQPKKAITSIQVSNRGVPVFIPKSAYHNIYEPKFKTLKVYLGPNSDIYIEMDNGAANAPYSVIWTIRNGRYFKKFVENTVPANPSYYAEQASMQVKN